MLTDPISDFLTRLRNALAAQHASVEIPFSSQKIEIARILKEQGYIDDFSVEPAAVGQLIKISLKYTDDRRPAISGLERVSRPGRRRYVSRREVPRVLGGMGTAIVSTSHGVMSGHEAKSEGVGGEVVAYVW
jgi:small subunit ribosomal protein S8